MRQVATRRTQATRRADTQSKILEAAVEVLAELGYSGTTTTEICRHAGVSQGALFRYWATKSELLAATSSHVFDRILADYTEMFEQAQGAAQSAVEVGVDLLWNIYHQRYLQARTELLVGARTDSELATALAALEPAHIAQLSAMARKLFPEIAAARPDFDHLVFCVIWAVQGAAMGTAALPVHREETRASLRQSLLAIAEAMLGPGFGVGPEATDSLAAVGRGPSAGTAAALRRPGESDSAPALELVQK